MIKNKKVSSILSALIIHVIMLIFLLFSIHLPEEKVTIQALPAYFTPLPQAITSSALPPSLKGIIKKKTLTRSTPTVSTNESTINKIENETLLTLLHNAAAEHLIYPSVALDFNETGTVTVQFLLHPSGEIENILVTHSSGHSSLDEAAINAIRDISPFSNAQYHLKNSKILSIDIVFKS